MTNTLHVHPVIIAHFELVRLLVVPPNDKIVSVRQEGTCLTAQKKLTHTLSFSHRSSSSTAPASAPRTWT